MGNNQATLLLGNAVGFHLAAQRIANGGTGIGFPWPPFFANVGYAFELSLKAYILQRGGNEQDCHRVGHDLQATVKKAREYGLTQPNQNVTALINTINRYHRDHSFRYMKSIDVSMLPCVGQALAVTNQHLTSVAEQLPELLPDWSNQEGHFLCSASLGEPRSERQRQPKNWLMCDKQFAGSLMPSFEKSSLGL